MEHLELDNIATPERVLFPTDFSRLSNAAASWAVDLVRRFDSHLDIIHVLQPPSIATPEGYVLPTGPFMDDVRGQVRKWLENERERLQAALPGIRVETALLEGTPFVEIVQYARQRAVDLIVIGTHGRSGIRHALLGSVTEKVVRKAPCAVLTVRAPDQPEFEAP